MGNMDYEEHAHGTETNRERIGEADDFCSVGDGLDVFFAQLTEEGVDVVL